MIGIFGTFAKLAYSRLAIHIGDKERKERHVSKKELILLLHSTLR